MTHVDFTAQGFKPFSKALLSIMGAPNRAADKFRDGIPEVNKIIFKKGVTARKIRFLMWLIVKAQINRPRKEGPVMSHTLKIGVSKCQADNGIVSCRRVDLRERLLRLLLGEKRRLTILVPGDSVKTLSIVEEAEEGEVR